MQAVSAPQLAACTHVALWTELDSAAPLSLPVPGRGRDCHLLCWLPLDSDLG